MRAIVGRYGAGGSFWSDTSDAYDPPYEPIIEWQIWNEPSSQTYYRPKPKVKGYAKLVKISHDAITEVDPSAQIVLAGVFPEPEGGKRFRLEPYLSALYRVRGLPKHFDTAALHPYARTIKGLKSQIKRVRQIMRKAGVAKKKLWISEVGWGSDPPVANRPLIKGEQGQKELLEDSFELLRGQQRHMEPRRGAVVLVARPRIRLRGLPLLLLVGPAEGKRQPEAVVELVRPHHRRPAAGAAVTASDGPGQPSARGPAAHPADPAVGRDRGGSPVTGGIAAE